MIKNRVCIYCNRQFNIQGRVFSNHVRWCNKNMSWDRQKFSENISKKRKLYDDKIMGYLKQFNVKCHKCKKMFKIKQRQKHFPLKEKYYCSISCSNSKSLSQERILKIRNKMLKFWQDDKYRLKMLEVFKKNDNKYFTSKNQRMIRQHFINNFKDDDWTFGGNIKFKDFSISRDLYSNKLRVCFQYDGIWHFKNINDQLKQKQKKDRALQEWCNNNNFRIIRVSQSWFNGNKKDIKMIQDLIYNKKDKIIKIGNEYSPCNSVGRVPS